MEAILSAIYSFLGLIIIAATFYNFFAIPIGLVLIILKAFKKIHYRWRTVLLIGFGGLLLVIAVFILNFLIIFIAALMGVNNAQFDLPQE